MRDTRRYRQFNFKERQAFDFIEKFILNKKYAPSFDEIVLNTEYSSKASVHSLLQKLKYKGVIDYVEGQARTITLPNTIIKIQNGGIFNER